MDRKFSAYLKKQFLLQTIPIVEPSTYSIRCYQTYTTPYWYSSP